MRKLAAVAFFIAASLSAVAQQNTAKTDPAVLAVAKDNTAKVSNIIQEKLNLPYNVLSDVQGKEYELETEYLTKVAKTKTLAEKFSLQKTMKEKRLAEMTKIIPSDKIDAFKNIERNAANVQFGKMTQQEQAAVKSLGGAEKVLGWDLTVFKM